MSVTSATSYPLVSVIIRSMDRPTLSDVLDSVALQTYPNIEVVVVNAKGAGHHEMGEWCGRFPLRLVGTGERLQRSRAANRGLDDAGGEFLIFLDDDDSFEAEHIEKLVQAIENHPDVKVVYSEVKCVDGDKNPLPTKFATPFDSTQLLAGNYIPIHAALFSKKLLELGCRMDESLDLYEDWDFWMQASMFTDFLLAEGFSAVYRINQQSDSGVHANDNITENVRLTVIKKWLPRLRDKQLKKLIATVQLQHIQKQLLEDRGQHIKNLDGLLADKDGQLQDKDGQLQDKDGQLQDKERALQQMLSSTSWKLTAPIRWSVHQVKRAIHLLCILPMLLQRGGGVVASMEKFITVVRREGYAGIKRRLRTLDQVAISVMDENGQLVDSNDYSEWVRRYDTLNDAARKRIRVRIGGMPHRPKISIVMPVYDPPLQFLDEAIGSVRKQLYADWELCIADDASTNEAVRDLLKRHAAEDARIRLVFRTGNGHISRASNSALELATGEFVALFDNDDLLPEHALFCVAKAILANPDAALIYSDEDKVDQSGRRYDPYFKSDWNPDLFLSQNMISHLGVYRADLVRKLGGFREGYEGSQDYDLALRCTEQLAPQQIVHIPRVLYHWRSHPGSAALAWSEKGYAYPAGERALNDHFARVSVSAKAELLNFGMYRARYDVPEPAPLVSLIIPTRNRLNLIKQCVKSILDKTTYKNYEILIVDNNSDDPKTLKYFASLVNDSRIRVLRDERPFNYLALNNAAVLHARGEYLGLINNDIEVISPQWLDEMVSLAAQPGVGAVGARLWYPNDTLQHGGVITGMGGVASHSHKHLPKGQFGYFGRAQLIQTLSAVTGACLVIKKSIYQELGGLDEINLKVAFNDIDFCLRVREAGYRNIWTPYAELYHHESATRGYENTPGKKMRFRDEVLYMQNRWGEILLNDPAYSPNLTLDREDFSFAWPPRVDSL